RRDGLQRTAGARRIARKSNDLSRRRRHCFQSSRRGGGVRQRSRAGQVLWRPNRHANGSVWPCLACLDPQRRRLDGRDGRAREGSKCEGFGRRTITLPAAANNVESSKTLRQLMTAEACERAFLISLLRILSVIVVSALWYGD